MTAPERFTVQSFYRPHAVFPTYAVYDEFLDGRTPFWHPTVPEAQDHAARLNATLVVE